ncbi:MAG: peptidoglycan DD-metalloendopeptidase family protein [Gaiellaceae bacterium]
MRRVALLTTAFLMLAGTAAGSRADDPREQQAELNEKITSLRDRIAAANQREQVLSSQISLVTAKIRSLEDDVHRASNRLHAIESDLAVYRNKLAALTQLYRLQTANLNQLKRDHVAAEARANRRLVAIYQEGDPSAVEVVLAARSFSDMLDQLDYLEDIGQQDRSIAEQVKAAKTKIAQARRKTNGLRKNVSAAAQTLEVKLDAQLAERNRLVSAQDELDAARDAKQGTLSRVEATREEFLAEVAALEQASQELAAKIQSAQSGSTVVPSGQGFIWPVSGTLTSTFGWRWGRMHQGIDISAASGTPIRAAASGAVIYSGWLGGYGNLVVIDHGGGLSTAYAHNSSNAVSPGQQVAQGQVIAYLGSTGYSTGPHVHFEVRVNGAAVDPLGYL